MTCKHAEDVFLDQALQTRVSTFITARELRAEVVKRDVVAVVVVAFYIAVLVCHRGRGCRRFRCVFCFLFFVIAAAVAAAADA